MKELLTKEQITYALGEIAGSDLSGETVATVITALRLLLPRPVKSGPWKPDTCPTCGKQLSENLGDGRYAHPDFLERCPECGQMLEWSVPEETGEEQDRAERTCERCRKYGEEYSMCLNPNSIHLGNKVDCCSGCSAWEWDRKKGE